MKWNRESKRTKVIINNAHVPNNVIKCGSAQTCIDCIYYVYILIDRIFIFLKKHITWSELFTFNFMAMISDALV